MTRITGSVPLSRTRILPSSPSASATAYDGDADRCIAVDENGNVVDGDLILYVCGKYMKEHGQLKDDTIVTTIMSNLGLYKACDKIGMKYEKTHT